jgi:hypothetical protein
MRACEEQRLCHRTGCKCLTLWDKSQGDATGERKIYKGGGAWETLGGRERSRPPVRTG